MEMQYFEEYFRTIALEEESSIALFRDDGAILARHPHVDPARLVVRAGGAVSSELLSNILSRTESGAVRQIGSIDGEDRVIVAHRLAHYPFVVMTTTTVAAALADWRHAAGFLICAAVLLVLMLGAIILLGVRRFRREQRLAAARARKADAESARPGP